MDTTVISDHIVSGIMLAMAVFERFRSVKASEREKQSSEKEKAALIDAASSKQQQSINADILAGKDSLISLHKETADAERLRYENEHAQYLKYREDTHAILNDANSKLLKVSEENGILKAKTDLTPVFKFQEIQETINEKIVTSLNTTQQSLVEILKHLQERK